MTTCSVVVPACNEGPDLETTVACLCSGKVVPDEIIIVDDGSTKPLKPRLIGFRRYTDIRVIRNEARTGSGQAKSQGLDAARGDLLVVTDAHTRPPWDWLEHTKAAFARWPDSAMCPISFGFKHPATFCGRGCRWVLDKRGFWNATWTPRGKREPENGAVIGCLMGGFYIFGRELMHRLGGYAHGHVRWGAEQDQFSLRCWSAGYDCRLLTWPLPHHYTHEDHPQDWLKVNDRVADHWGVWANRHRMMATLWEDESLYELVYGPAMRRHYWPAGLASWWSDAGELIAEDRRRIAGLRRRTDEEMAQVLIGGPQPRSVAEVEIESERHVARCRET